VADWFYGSSRECCHARQPWAPQRTLRATIASAASISYTNKHSQTTPAGSTTALPTAHPTAHKTSTRSSRLTKTAKRSTSKTAPSISPPEISEDSKSYEKSKSSVSDDALSAILCVLSLCLLCVLAACFVVVRRKKRVGNEPPHDYVVA
jgi:cobalamin biosynthesis Mg chelatase CobN